MQEEVRDILQNSHNQKIFEEFYEIVRYIVESEEFQKRKTFLHHGKESVFAHSLRVSFLAYKIAKYWGLHQKDTAIGGLLHDFYTIPWQLAPPEKRFFHKHLFYHPTDALKNILAFYPNDINDRVINIVLRHMFPINIIPPKYIEGWIVNWADKMVSFSIIRDIPIYLKWLKQKIYNNNANDDCH